MMPRRRLASKGPDGLTRWVAYDLRGNDPTECDGPAARVDDVPRERLASKGLIGLTL